MITKTTFSSSSLEAAAPGGWIVRPNAPNPFWWGDGDPVQYLSVGSIKDDFGSGVINPQWFIFTGGTAATTFPGGVVDFSITGADSVTEIVSTLSTYQLYGSRMYARMVRPLTVSGTVAGAFTFFNFVTSDDVGNGTGNAIIIQYTSDGFISSNIQLGGSNTGQVSGSAAYNASTHAWLSIRESGGTVYWETAPSTASNPPLDSDWVVLDSFPTKSLGFSLRRGTVQLGAHIFGALTQTQSAQFDSVNTSTFPLLSGVSATTAINTTTVDVNAPLTGVSSTTTVNTTTVTDTVAPTGVAATAAVNTTTVTDTVSPTGVAATSAVNTTTVTDTVAPTGVAATAAVNTTTVTDAVAPTGVAATSAVNKPSVTDTVAPTGVAASSALNTTSVTDTVGATGTSGTGSPGTVSPSSGGAANLTGIVATAAVGSVAPTSDGIVGKSHADLYIRQLLEEYYEREWNREPKKPEVAPRKRKRPVRQAIEELVEDSPYLSLEPVVKQLVAQQVALKVQVASLQHSYGVQSQQLAASQEEDDDLLLLSAIL